VFPSWSSEKTGRVKTNCLPFPVGFWHASVSMFLPQHHRIKDGKIHRYFSIVENHRIASDKTVQRTVLYLGEINDQQQVAWRKTLSVLRNSSKSMRT